jgi:exodeoxyribonuclease VII large subunit
MLSVLQLTRLIKDTLTGSFPSVWVRGEISNVQRATSGHFYFDLKEGREAILPCVIWASTAARMKFAPVAGVEAEAYGAISVFEPRGRYQLVLQVLRPAGLGALLVKLEELKRKLQAEGLFDAARKRPLPRYPRRVGLVTSPVGAAVHDLVTRLRGRWPATGIVLAPVRVQGPGAATEIANAIRRFGRLGGVDVLIVGRGGGSLEELWAFNEEPVVRAIAASPIPVVTAIGHEVDQTLADLAADVRAATPSHAAELVVPDRRDIAHRVEVLHERGTRAVRHRVAHGRRRLEAALARYAFRRQRELFASWRQRIDEMLARAEARVREALARGRERLGRATNSYGLREWPRTLTLHRERAGEIGQRLAAAIATGIQERRARVTGYDDQLQALSPRRVLVRGYCLARKPDGTFVRSAAELVPGDGVTIEFARGEADARVEAVRVQEDEGGEENR